MLAAYATLVAGLLLPAPQRARPAQCCAANGEDRHTRWMHYALELAERGRLSTAPNPWVGCVIVAADGETVLAEGWHQRKGKMHAEATALADAVDKGVTREQMESATMYVTLEPCHRGPGKTTPPCDEAIVASGVRDLHIAVLDPDPSFANANASYLRSNGVAVTLGTGGAAVEASLRPYLHQRRTKQPYVVLKVASATDGSIACADGTSQWITGPGARAHAQMLRAESQAILVGSGTALADSPRLNVRLSESELPDSWLMPSASPLRVVLDARGRVVDGPLLDTSLAPTLIFTTAASAGSAARAAWEAAGVDVVEVAASDASDGGGVCLEAALKELGARGVIQMMVEGGGAVHGAFLSTPGCAQQLRLYVGATALGSSATRWIRAPLAGTIDEAPRWELLGVQQLGNDACLDYALDGQ